MMKRISHDKIEIVVPVNLDVYENFYTCPVLLILKLNAMKFESILSYFKIQRPRSYRGNYWMEP
jgi:hypothetical protein